MAAKPTVIEVKNGQKAKVENLIALRAQRDTLDAEIAKLEASVLDIAAPAHVAECRKTGEFVPSVLIQNAKGEDLLLVTFSQATTEVTATMNAVANTLGNEQKATTYFSIETKWSLQSGLSEAHFLGLKTKLGDKLFGQTFKSKSLLTPKGSFVTDFLVKGEHTTEVEVLQKAGLLSFKSASIKVK